MGCAESTAAHNLRQDCYGTCTSDIIRGNSIITIRRSLGVYTWFLNDPTTSGDASQYKCKIYDGVQLGTHIYTDDGNNFTLLINSRVYRFSTLEYVQKNGIYTLYGKYYFDIDSFLKYGKFPIKCKYDRTELTDVKIILHTFTDCNMFPFSCDQKTDRTFTLWTSISNVKMPSNLAIKSLTFKSAIDQPIIEYCPIEKLI